MDDKDALELLRRASGALQRHLAGHAPMRVPVDLQTDSDIVKSDIDAYLLRAEEVKKAEPKLVYDKATRSIPDRRSQVERRRLPPTSSAPDVERDTPRTDAKWARIEENLPFALASKSPVKSLGEVVPADFARQLERELATAHADAGALQAQIDRLMLEYCPDEMTPKQIEEWKAHQVAATADLDLPHIPDLPDIPAVAKDKK